jgi:hypothetical protein
MLFDTKPSLPVVALPLRYVGDPQRDLERIAEVPDDLAADAFTFRKWLIDDYVRAPLTKRRLITAIQLYASPVSTSGFVVDLTHDGGLEDAPQQFIRLAGEAKEPQ